MGKLPHTAFALALFVISGTARGDLATDVNRLRSRGCDGRPGIEAQLSSSRSLDEVARVLSSGGLLGDAVEKAGYRVIDSQSINIHGIARREYRRGPRHRCKHRRQLACESAAVRHDNEPYVH